MALDLHVHSTFSDGTMSPAELVELARVKRLVAIALTDHDTVDGFIPAQQAAAGMSLEVIAGLEFSVLHQGTSMHILGYLMDIAHADLNRMLADLQKGRIERNAKILDKLQGLGISIEPDELRQVSVTGQTGRPHIARLLLAKGAVGSMLQAFEQYLGRKGLAYVSRPVPTAEDAIAVLRAAGGLCVLAHPQQMDPDLKQLPALLDELVPMGLDGLEAYYPTHSSRTRRKIIAAAEHYGLVLTGGSDFHGDIRPGTTLAGGRNVYVPDELLSILKDRAASR
ncbi:PHP domain-containing protein [Desulfoprunum benzoelyticum]|uniref:Polymerase/histidinol phosphatase N-terminal domain-containing protein n=1 Tax=Desulfoprunum benzoelyticum TaxID=1506996 RepID=A0A840UJ17_9BACT|nr:PHP domain-containing protein [Desulfoprunum benzoelyticum]MBB5346347.1 hypothetical protein [Desulfoprunum benzoelyticum]MBM9528654.1 PHP domain-containing protein [Desulfoprunum benzoelyticum]